MPFRILAALVLSAAMAVAASSSGLAQPRNGGTKQPEKSGIWYIPGTDTYRVIKIYPANNAAAKAECGSWQGRLVKVGATEYQCRKQVEYKRPPVK
jgi:hypothetical protein